VGRLGISFALVAVATLVGLFALTSNWAQRSALDTEAWAQTSRELLDDGAIRREVAAQILAQTGAPGGPDAQAALAEALSRPEIEALWVAANEQAHALLVAVVDESAFAGSLGTEGDRSQLELDLNPIAELIGAELGLPPGALGDVALEVLTANELEALRGADDLLDAVAIGTLIGALMLYATAFAIAPTGRRRLAALAISGSLVVIGALTLIIRSASADAAIEELSPSPGTEEAAERAWLIGTSGLADLATILVVVGSVGIAAGIVLGLIGRSREREYVHP
jgi:hypothetical protein